MLHRSRIPVVFILGIALVIASCSGQGETGSGSLDNISLSALILPERLSVVDPTGGTGSPKPSLFRSIISALTLTGIPPASDYANDKVTVYVNERSLETFGQVSEILCMIRQSRYDVMMNRGPYLAQIDKNLCSGERSNASSAGEASTNQSSGATMPFYETWTVNSFRSSSASPHIVQVWVHSVERNGDPPKLIYAKVVITEGADTAPPYGIFSANFKFYDPATDPGLTTILAKGFLNAERDPLTGRVLLYFATEDKDSYFIEKATLDKNPLTNSGAGSVLKAETAPWMPLSITRFNLAYNAGSFLRSDNTGSICLDRTNIVESAWRYGLYTTTAPEGTRVARASNFPVKTSGGVYGSIGYWGQWFPNNVTVSDGEQVYKHDYSNNTDTPYTVMQRGGKLKKYRKDTVPLDEIKNVPLVWFTGGTAYLVTWATTTTGPRFETVAQVQQDGSWSTTGPFADNIDLSNLQWVELGFWSQALGGSVIVKLHDPATGHFCTTTSPYDCSSAADATTPVVYYRESIIFPGDTVPSSLICFSNCPDPTKLTTSNPFYPDMSFQGTSPDLATHYTYSFDTVTMRLTDAGTGGEVVFSSGTNTFYQNGITSGVLSDPTTTSQLACPWNAANTCAGMAWTVLNEFYIWETGPNTWNKFITLLDNGTPVKFDPPLQVKYVHSQPTLTAPDHKYDGVTFFLEYSGFGELHGIPGKCVDIDLNTDADCKDSGTNRAIRWVPEFTIPNEVTPGGNLTELTDVGQPTVTYFVKSLEKEQRLGPVGDCTGLSTSPYTLPSMSSWIDPIIGDEPVVTSPPAVIGGVVQ